MIYKQFKIEYSFNFHTLQCALVSGIIKAQCQAHLLRGQRLNTSVARLGTKGLSMKSRWGPRALPSSEGGSASSAFAAMTGSRVSHVSEVVQSLPILSTINPSSKKILFGPKNKTKLWVSPS